MSAKDDLVAGNIIGAKIEGSALENSFKITKNKGSNYYFYWAHWTY